MKRVSHSPSFAPALLAWYRRVRAPLPWREQPTAYRTWIAEVMAQQTTLAVVVPRYRAFVLALPDVFALAACDEAHLRTLWAGLGYYARARHLQQGAQQLVAERAGRLPESYDAWLRVQGCGPYTAAVVASIINQEPVPCIDGNVSRVGSRLFAIGEGLWHTAGREQLHALLSSAIVYAEHPGDFNQGMMELGQKLCRKSRPECAACPVAAWCRAWREGTVDRYPPPRQRPAPVDASLTALVLEDARGAIALGPRTGRFLRGTVGLPLLEGKAAQVVAALGPWLAQGSARVAASSFSHAITRHRIRAEVLLGRCPAHPLLADPSTLNLESLCWTPIAGAAARVASSLDHKALAILAAESA